MSSDTGPRTTDEQTDEPPGEPRADRDATVDEKAQEEESQKSYETILAQQIEDGLVEINRPTEGQLLSGLSAGLDVGFGPLLVAVLLTLPQEGMAEPLFELFLAVGYAVGFVFVVVGRSELFTEQTTLAILPVLNGQATYSDLAKVWTVVWTGNVLGGAAFAGIAVVTGQATGIVTPDAFSELALGLVEYSWWATVLAGILAGWLMGLLSWLVGASRDTISVVVVVVIVTGAIGFAHLPHSIAGNVEVLFGVFTGAVDPAAYLQFLALTTFGNAVGGVVFVALIKNSHARRGGEEPEAIRIPEPDDGREPRWVERRR